MRRKENLAAAAVRLAAENLPSMSMFPEMVIILWGVREVVLALCQRAE